MTSKRKKPLDPNVRLLQAATALFSAKGFRGTSMREVARLGRVNEVTVYRQFKNKQFLYRRVLQGKMSSLEKALQETLTSTTSDQTVFRSVAVGLEGIADVTFLRLLCFAALEQPQIIKHHVRPLLASFYTGLVGHLQEKMMRGSLRQTDPHPAARALIGMVFFHSVFCEILGIRGAEEFLRSKTGYALEGYADIWFNGVLKPRPARRQVAKMNTTAAIA